MENVEVARILEETADLLAIQRANRFRIRAYRNAVRTIDSLPRRLEDLVAAGERLTSLPGIGPEIERHILEILASGRLRRQEELLEDVPRSLMELVALQGVGPRRAKRLWDELKIDSVDKLEAEIRAGRVQALAGFGEKSCQKILTAIERHRTHAARFLKAEVEPLLDALIRYVQAAPGVLEVQAAGSYRRARETVGDLDLLVRADGDGGPVLAHFAAYPGAARVEASGANKGSLVLRSGLQVDLRVIPSEAFGAALHYFTGSKEHNVRVRALGVRKGLRINEWGVFRAASRASGGGAGAREGEGRSAFVAERAASETDSGDARGEVSAPHDTVARFGPRLGGATEEEVFALVGLPWIPPELREDRGEIEAAQRGRLPILLTRPDLRGDLQMHSTWSDGRHSIEEMARGCLALGYQYLALTDHSQSLTMTGGLTPERVRLQWKEIEEVRGRLEGIELLRSLEVDVLKDGTLDMPDDVLAGLDLVVVSVHSFMDMDQASMTERVLKAISHPEVDILAHPTGRKLNRRLPYALDVEAVLEAALDLNVAVELNASPDRLDLSDVHVRRARELGVKVAVNTDAHSVRGLATMRYGVEQARRGWLEAKDVLNALPLEDLRAWLGRRKA